MLQRHAYALGVLAPLVVGCGHKDDAAAAAITSAPVEETISRTAKLASIAMQTNVYAEPSQDAKKLGYLRLGAVVPRSERAHGTSGCPGGWYAIAPAGYVCAGKTATLEVEAPLVRAASVRPDQSRPLPYAYGFVRAVSPLYVRLPTTRGAERVEYKLANHLRWVERHADEINRVRDGANDAARELFPDSPEVPRSSTLPPEILLGGKTDADPVPFWLENDVRSIPNVSGFEVPQTSYFANRVRRHNGLAFVGTFDSGILHGHRKFAVTTDLRLIPVDRVKPETASAFHGVELSGDVTLPVAFAKPCDPHAKGPPEPCRRAYLADGDKLRVAPELLGAREMLRLTGKDLRKNGRRFLETHDGRWVRTGDVGIAAAPKKFPLVAERGERWIDVSIEEQTLVLWEGKRPVFATLVTTGQDGLADPKTSKATIRGFFRVKSKHVTATMDSNERSSQSGGAAPDPRAGESPTADDKHAGNFELRDVPYVQYFHDGYALHAAYWHDHFGLPRSHGCINLAPIDAMRVFRFTEPAVPEGWHGVLVEKGQGTPVIVHR